MEYKRKYLDGIHAQHLCIGAATSVADLSSTTPRGTYCSLYFSKPAAIVFAGIRIMKIPVFVFVLVAIMLAALSLIFLVL